LALSLHGFTEIGGSAEWLQKVGDFLETFPPEGAKWHSPGGETVPAGKGGRHWLRSRTVWFSSSFAFSCHWNFLL